MSEFWKTDKPTNTSEAYELLRFGAIQALTDDEVPGAIARTERRMLNCAQLFESTFLSMYNELATLRAENENLRHDLDRVVQRETDLIADNEALQAAMAEWQERAIAFVRGRYAGRAEGSDVWLEIGKIVRGIERLTAPTLDRGREIAEDVACDQLGKGWTSRIESALLAFAKEVLEREWSNGPMMIQVALSEEQTTKLFREMQSAVRAKELE